MKSPILKKLDKPSQKFRILKWMANVQPEGLMNYNLNTICFRYGARIMELRRDGFEIETERIKQGLFKFTLITPACMINWDTLKPIVQEELRL